MPNIADYVTDIGATSIAPWAGLQPEELTAQAAGVVEALLASLASGGNSIHGSDVNLEAGSVICNHRNEHRAAGLSAAAVKFGALVGDGARIGANAVVAPGTVLRPNSIVGRFELVDQQRH